jgi:outer membrane protein OmpA-like peptidoglycan-associated protein
MRTMIASVALACLAACATTEPTQSSKTEILSGRVDFPPDLGRGASRAEIMTTMVYLPVEVERICAGMEPKFEVNSAKLEPSDNPSLRVLADCMRTGPLANRTLRLIGHADMRGSVPLNDRLGMRRAESVKLFLMKSGIPSERLTTETRGKDGSEPPPADWDRRVEFELATP